MHSVDKDPDPRDAPRVAMGVGSLLAVVCDVQVDFPPPPPLSLPFSFSFVPASCLGENVVKSSPIAGLHRGDWRRHFIIRP